MPSGPVPAVRPGEGEPPVVRKALAWPELDPVHRLRAEPLHRVDEQRVHPASSRHHGGAADPLVRPVGPGVATTVRCTPETLENPPVAGNDTFVNVWLTRTQSSRAHPGSAAVAMMWRVRSRSS